MKFNLAQQVISAKAIRMIKASGSPELPPAQTIQQIICQLLLQGVQNEQASFEEKMKRYKLLDKVSDDPVVDLDLAEINVITGVYQKACPTLVVGCLEEFFNNPMKEAPVPEAG